jgi:hypothetical protein
MKCRVMRAKTSPLLELARVLVRLDHVADSSPLIEWLPNRIVIGFATAQAFFLANVYRVNRVDFQAEKLGLGL